MWIVQRSKITQNHAHIAGIEDGTLAGIPASTVPGPELSAPIKLPESAVQLSWVLDRPSVQYHASLFHRCGGSTAEVLEGFDIQHLSPIPYAPYLYLRANTHET